MATKLDQATELLWDTIQPRLLELNALIGRAIKGDKNADNQLANLRIDTETLIDLDFARRVLKSQLEALAEDVIPAIVFQLNEVEILDQRLARRYDPGLALQEATNRAIAEKRTEQQHKWKIKEEVRDNGGNIIRPAEYATISTKLTSAQEKALIYQKQIATRRMYDK
jgi:hypothetical protein